MSLELTVNSDKPTLPSPLSRERVCLLQGGRGGGNSVSGALEGDLWPQGYG